MRKKKEEERIKRLEQEEIERRVLDAQEEQLLVEDRKRAIDKANMHMHNS